MQSFLNLFFSERLAGHHDRIAAKAERSRLRAELASYSTDAERAELDAIFSRHTAEDLAELERATGWHAAA